MTKTRKVKLGVAKVEKSGRGTRYEFPVLIGREHHGRLSFFVVASDLSVGSAMNGTLFLTDEESAAAVDLAIDALKVACPGVR